MQAQAQLAECHAKRALRGVRHSSVLSLISFSRAERVDRVESVALLDAKRPYSTLMFSRKERKGRKERTG